MGRFQTQTEGWGEATKPWALWVLGRGPTGTPRAPTEEEMWEEPDSVTPGDSLASILPRHLPHRVHLLGFGAEAWLPTCIPCSVYHDLMLALRAAHGLEGFAQLCRWRNQGSWSSMPRLGAGSHLTWVPAGTLVEFGQGDHTTLFSQVLKVALILCPGSINSGQLTLPRAAWGGGGSWGFPGPAAFPLQTG